MDNEANFKHEGVSHILPKISIAGHNAVLVDVVDWACKCCSP